MTSSRGGLDLEDTVLDGEEGHIEGSSEVENWYVVLTADLLVETIGNSSGSRSINDT